MYISWEVEECSNGDSFSWRWRLLLRTEENSRMRSADRLMMNNCGKAALYGCSPSYIHKYKLHNVHDMYVSCTHIVFNCNL